MSNIVLKCRFAVGSDRGLKQFITDHNGAEQTVETQWFLYNSTNFTADRELAEEYSDKQFIDPHGIMDQYDLDENPGEQYLS